MSPLGRQAWQWAGRGWREARVSQKDNSLRALGRTLGILKSFLTLLLRRTRNVATEGIPFPGSSAFLSRPAVSQAPAASAPGGPRIRGSLSSSWAQTGPRVGPARPDPSECSLCQAVTGQHFLCAHSEQLSWILNPPTD